MLEAKVKLTVPLGGLLGLLGVLGVLGWLLG